jgi:hypothetical protein
MTIIRPEHQKRHPVSEATIAYINGTLETWYLGQSCVILNKPFDTPPDEWFAAMNLVRDAGWEVVPTMGVGLYPSWRVSHKDPVIVPP